MNKTLRDYFIEYTHDYCEFNQLYSSDELVYNLFRDLILIIIQEPQQGLSFFKEKK